MPVVMLDTSTTNPLAELEANGLIQIENESDNIVPRPTQKFCREFEEFSKSNASESCDLVGAVHRIMSRYEPVDTEIYSIYMLMALANSSERVQWGGKSIDLAAVLRESGVTSLIELFCVQ
jgi:hypothetical protein